jgi:uncharacterized protein (DUF58 family)
LQGLLTELSALPPLVLSDESDGEGLRHGDLKGRIMEVGYDLEENRLYQTGDSVRHVNWRLSARTDQLYVKYQPKPTELRAKLLVDLRHSTWQGSRVRLKAEQMVRVAFRVAKALASMAVVDTQVWSSTPEALPILRGDSRWMTWAEQWTALLPALANSTVGAAPSLSEALLHVSDQWLVVISDFIDWDAQLEAQLLDARGRGRVWLIHVLDPMEVRLPSVRGVQVGELAGLDMGDSSARAAYQQAIAARLTHITQIAEGMDYHYWPCYADAQLHLLGKMASWT